MIMMISWYLVDRLWTLESAREARTPSRIMIFKFKCVSSVCLLLQSRTYYKAVRVGRGIVEDMCRLRHCLVI